MSLIDLIDPAYLKAQLAHLDVDLSTRASETTLAGIKSQTDKLTFDGSSYLYVNAPSVGNPPNLDVALSTRASESTLSGVKSQVDKLTFDGSGYLYTNAAVVANPPNLDVALSTRLADSKIPNPLAQLSKDVGGSTVNALATIPSGSPMDLTRQPTYDELSVGTTESSITYSAPGLKLAILINRGDNDVLVRINDSAGTQIKIPARCGKVIGFGGITTLYYVVSAGSSTLVVNGWS